MQPTLEIGDWVFDALDFSPASPPRTPSPMEEDDEGLPAMQHQSLAHRPRHSQNVSLFSSLSTTSGLYLLLNCCIDVYSALCYATLLIKRTEVNYYKQRRQPPNDGNPRLPA